MIINTYIMSVQVQEGPGNYDDNIQDQCVLVTQAQPTEERPPQSKLTKYAEICILQPRCISFKPTMIGITYKYQMVWTIVPSSCDEHSLHSGSRPRVRKGHPQTSC